MRGLVDVPRKARSTVGKMLLCNNGKMRGVFDLTHLPHGIHGLDPEFVVQVIALYKTDAMLARDCAFHLDGTLDHAMDDAFGYRALFVVEENDCWIVNRDGHVSHTPSYRALRYSRDEKQDDGERKKQVLEFAK